jgi:hypothetical protein
MQVSRNKRIHWKVASMIAVLGLIVAACGDGDTDDATDDTDSTEETEAEEPDEEEELLEEDDVAEADEEAEVDESAFYFGKELEILVPFSTGGGTDTQARFFAPFLPNYVPGSPSVGVFNIAGAGGTIGNNQFWNERDYEEATSVLFSSASSFFPWVFEEPALDLDYTQLTGTMAIQTGGMVFVHENTGITGPEDFADAVREGTVDWVAGEQTPDSLGLLFLLHYDMLGMDPNVVMGFEGRGPARVSFEQEELNVNWDTTASVESSVSELIEAGTAIPVYSPGQVVDGELVRDPVYDDIPHFGEMYEMVHGEAPSGELYDSVISLTLAGFTLQKVMWLHQDAPQEAVDDLMQGFADMTDDPAFQERALEIVGDYDLITGADVQGAVDTLLDFPEERRAFLIDYMVENYDYVDPR